MVIFRAGCFILLTETLTEKPNFTFNLDIPRILSIREIHERNEQRTFSEKTDIDFRMQLLGGATYSEVTLAHGDFDGDGLPEYLVLNDDLSINNSMGFNPTYTAGLSGEEYFLTDINGNGKIELVFKNPTGSFSGRQVPV